MGMIRSFFRRLRLLVAFAVLALAVFLFRDEIADGVSSLLNQGGEQIVMAETVDELRPDVIEELMPGSAAEPTPSSAAEVAPVARELTPEEVALRVEATFYDIAYGRGDREVRISEAELQMYVRHRLVVPAGFSSPAIELRDSTAAVSASVNVGELQMDDQARAALGRFIPGDTARVSGEVFGEMVGPGEGRVRILSVQAGRLQIPGLLVAMALSQFGLATDDRGIVVPLVEDIIEVRVENEEVVIIRNR